MLERGPDSHADLETGKKFNLAADADAAAAAVHLISSYSDFYDIPLKVLWLLALCATFINLSRK